MCVHRGPSPSAPMMGYGGKKSGGGGGGGGGGGMRRGSEPKRISHQPIGTEVSYNDERVADTLYN